MKKRIGNVVLVGAGPGDPELITVRGRARLAEADVVVYDELAGTALLRLARPEAERIFVGKRCGKRAAEQEEIHAILIHEALNGRRVVRLKGGDPLVFGRGGEEWEALQAAGIPVEIVPGVTAAAAAGAAAAVPLTHRNCASGVVFLTGHESPAKPESTVDWEALARLRMTLCIYMGVRKLGTIAERLVEAGMPIDTPVAIVSRATWPDETVLRLSLHELVRGEQGEVPAPALAIIGEVAHSADRARALASTSLSASY